MNTLCLWKTSKGSKQAEEMAKGALRCQQEILKIRKITDAAEYAETRELRAEMMEVRAAYVAREFKDAVVILDKSIARLASCLREYENATPDQVLDWVRQKDAK